MKEFSYIKKGYDPAEVDEYIKRLEEVIKSYKDKDTSIKNAILSAQIAADSLILNAENEAEEIRKTANESVQKVLKDSLTIINEIKESLDVQRRFVEEFKQEYHEMINKYLKITNVDSFKEINRKINGLDSYLQEITINIQSQGYVFPISNDNETNDGSNTDIIEIPDES